MCVQVTRFQCMQSATNSRLHYSQATEALQASDEQRLRRKKRHRAASSFGSLYGIFAIMSSQANELLSRRPARHLMTPSLAIDVQGRRAILLAQ
jgi:hypothetical protein